MRRRPPCLGYTLFVVGLAVISQCDGFGMMGRVGTLPLRSRGSVSHRPVISRNAVGGATMQVWSNEQATQEYRDLLDGKAPKIKSDGPAVIVGGNGRLGSFLRGRGMGQDIVVGRGDEIPETIAEVGSDFPIYVCVPEDEVESVIRATPKNKVDDLVFVCEGNIEMMLKKYGLCGNENTQAVLNFKIMDVGSRPQDYRVDMGKDSFGEPKCAGETVVCGKWSDALVSRLERANIQCTKLFYRDWRRHMYERAAFESIFNLVGVLHDNMTIGEVAKYYFAEIEDMIIQINKALRGALALTLLYGVEERMFALAEGSNVEWRPTKLEKFKWRNGFIYAISKQATGMTFPDPCEMHTEYLEYARDKGFITEPLEPYNPYGPAS